MLLLLLLVCATVAGSCRVRSTPSRPSRPSAITGCEIVRDALGAQRCHLPASAGPHELVVWIEGEPLDGVQATLHSGWHERALPVEAAFMDRGTRLTVAVEGAGSLEVVETAHDRGSEPGVRRRWTVPLVVRPSTPGLDALLDRWSAWAEGSVPHGLLEDLEAFASTAPAWPAAVAWELRGEILQRTSSNSEAPDAVERALQAYERALELAGPDELSLRCRVGLRIAELHLVDRGSSEDAERAIERMTECEALGLPHEARVHNVRGSVAFARNDLVHAAAQFERAAAGAERMGLRRLGMVAAERLAAACVGMGTFEAAADAHRWASARAAELELGCDDQLPLAVFGLYAAVHDPREQGARIAEALQEVLDRHRECATSTSVGVATILDIAFALALEQRHEAALRWLDELDDHVLTPSHEMYRASIEADVAMARGDWLGAAAAADELAALLDAAPHEANVALEVQRELVRGRVAEAADDHETARLHLRRAVELQDRQLDLLPLALASSRVSAREAAPAGYLVQLEREQGEPEAALCTARLVRNRAGRRVAHAARGYARDRARYQPLVDAVRQRQQAFETADDMGFGYKAKAKAELLDAQQALLEALVEASARVGSTPEDECRSLPDPAPGELALLFHQGPDGRWWLFDWMLDAPVRIHDLGPGDPSPHDDPASLAARLLGPVGDRLEQASRLRLLTSGAVDAIAFEALPAGEGTLEDRVDITWALDLPVRPEARPASGAKPRPVVVFTDPILNLDRLRPRVDAVVQAAQHAWQTEVTTLFSRSTSTRDLSRLFATAEPLVIIGHSSGLEELDVEDPGCREPSSAQAATSIDPGRVRDPERPTPGLWINFSSLDLLTLLTLEPPRVAILESCATGAIDTLSMDGPVGLGHVLIATGARQVLATRRKVCLEQGVGFLQALVEAAQERPLDLPPLLRASRHADHDYVHRVLVP